LRRFLPFRTFADSRISLFFANQRSSPPFSNFLRVYRIKAKPFFRERCSHESTKYPGSDPPLYVPPPLLQYIPPFRCSPRVSFFLYCLPERVLLAATIFRGYFVLAFRGPPFLVRLPSGKPPQFDRLLTDGSPYMPIEAQNSTRAGILPCLPLRSSIFWTKMLWRIFSFGPVFA